MKKKPTPTDPGQVLLTKQGYYTAKKMQNLIVDTISEIDAETPTSKHPVTVTQGDSWVCLTSIIGQACMTIRFSLLKPEGGQP